MAAAHPPAPWHLVGPAVIVPALAARGSGPVAGTGAPGGGRTLGGLLAGAYDERSTLAYHELLAVQGIAWTSLLPAARITVARVDDDASVAGGRAIWGIPKRRATFDWVESPGRVEIAVSDAGGPVATISAELRRPGRPIPVLGRFTAVDGRPGWVRGRLRGAPARVNVTVAPAGPLAGHGLAWSPIGFVGEVDLRVAAPRRERR